jgi:hypothetical protein
MILAATRLAPPLDLKHNKPISSGYPAIAKMLATP